MPVPVPDFLHQPDFYGTERGACAAEGRGRRHPSDGTQDRCHGTTAEYLTVQPRRHLSDATLTGKMPFS